MNKVEEFYNNNQEMVHDLWDEHLFTNDWGSGEDRITITDEMFWEFTEDLMEEAC